MRHAPPRGLARPACWGVTLIEMLVVLVIIGLVATLTTLAVNSVIGNSKRKTARAQMSALEAGVMSFKMDQNRYAATLGDLETAPGGLPRPFPPGGYLQTKGVPLDPWGNPYQYAVGGEEGFTITSLGDGGTAGGAGEQADLSTNDPVDK